MNLPIDLLLEILSRASAKSVGRFRLASKFCASVVSRPDFTELFLTRTRARPPRLLFVIKGASEWRFYSSPQPQNSDGKSSLVVAADFHLEFSGNVCMEFSGNVCTEICGPVSGLLYFPYMRISKRNMVKMLVIYNPSTGQYMRLPKPPYDMRSFLGYDPIDKQFKLLSLSWQRFGECEPQVLTLGAGNVSWRKIQCPFHDTLSEGICINGVVYYLARRHDYYPARVKIACFDVRSEQLWFLDQKSVNESHFCWPDKLIDYKGKLCVITSQWLRLPDGRRTIKLCLWVLENAEKQEWSKRVFLMEPLIGDDVSNSLSLVGVTTIGEIVFSTKYTSKQVYVFYINPERNTTKTVDIRGFEAFENPCRVYTYVDHVEDPTFIT